MSTKKSVLLMLLCILLLSGSSPGKINVHTLGDSTMEQQNPNIKDQRGWPQFLQQFFSNDICIINHGKSGTSSKTFYMEGYWTRAKASIKPGDYVFIQFGHNDEKHNGEDGPVGTAPTDSFRIYLSKFVTEIRELGAYPILFTPVVRKMFDNNGKLSRRGKHDLGEYVQESVNPNFNKNDTITYNYPYNMKYVADSLQCPVTDMTTSTADLVNKLGLDNSTQIIYNLPKDGTHFGASGAVLFSMIAAQELKKQHILEKDIVLSADLAIAPDKINMGDVYIGTSQIQVFDVCCLEKDGTTGILNISANNGLMLSSEEKGSYSQTLNLPYKTIAELATFKLYVRCIPEKLGNISGKISISNGKSIKELPVSGKCIPLDNNQAISVSYKLYNHAKPVPQGAVTGLEEIWSGMVMDNYMRPQELGITDTENNYINTKVQCNKIENEKWPGNEIDVVYSRYIQFGLQAVKGSILHINEIKLTAGGGAEYRIVYSKDKNFMQATTLGERIGNGNQMIKHIFDMSQTVKEEEYFYIRIYPWSEKSISNIYLCLYDVQIIGTQTKK